MKTLLLTLGMTGLFFAVGVVGMRVLAPGASGDAEAAPADSVVTRAEVGEVAGEVADLRRQLSRAEARADSLRDLMDGHRESLEATQAQAAGLAATLAKLDDDALGGIVQRLDGAAFVDLYQASTNRIQVRLLSALTPAQAAAFVRHQLPGGRRPAGTPAPADTTAAP